MSENSQSKQQFLLGLFGGVAVISLIGMVIMGIILISGNSDGEVAGETETININNQPAVNNPVPASITPEVADVAGVSTFTQKKGAEICKEDGKPVVYLFSTTWCPHCTWTKDTFDRVAKEYIDAGKIVAHHWELDINDDTLTDVKETSVPASHQAVYQEFNPQGSIPTFVFGCKYFRIGNGHEAQDDLEAEEAEMRTLIESML